MIDVFVESIFCSSSLPAFYVTIVNLSTVRQTVQLFTIHAQMYPINTIVRPQKSNRTGNLWIGVAPIWVWPPLFPSHSAPSQLPWNVTLANFGQF